MRNKNTLKRRKVGTSSQRRQLLLSARAAGVRWREAWLTRLAADSLRFAWSLADIDAAVKEDIAAASAAKGLTNTSTAASEGRQAAHPSVRGELERLIGIRDEVCTREPDLIRSTVQRPSHVLIDLIRIQREAKLRHHAVNASAYLKYVRSRYTAGRVTNQVANLVASPPEVAQTTPSSSVLQRKRTPRIALTYQVDQATHEALRLKSFNARVSIQSLVDGAVQSWLQKQEREEV